MGGQQSYGMGGSGPGNGMNAMDGNMGPGMNSAQTATANLFEIKKRSIDFFQHVSDRPRTNFMLSPN